MNREVKQWVAGHRRQLNKAWKQELTVREISWEDFCAEMHRIWCRLACCRPVVQTMSFHVLEKGEEQE